VDACTSAIVIAGSLSESRRRAKSSGNRRFLRPAQDRLFDYGSCDEIARAFAQDDKVKRGYNVYVARVDAKASSDASFMGAARS
jgi:hypothetical protein